MTEETGVTKKREKQRNALNRFINTPVEFLIRHNLSPNILSYLGFMCSVGAAIFLGLRTIHLPIWFGWPAPFLMFMAGAFDVFDGEVARRTEREGAAGAFLDSNLDRLSDAVIILGLIYGGYVTYFLGYILLFVVIMISYTRSRAENEGINMKGVGIMERAERILILFGALILETWINFLGTLITGQSVLFEFSWICAIPVSWFFLIFILAYMGLIYFTLIQRLVFTFKKLKELT